MSARQKAFLQSGERKNLHILCYTKSKLFKIGIFLEKNSPPSEFEVHSYFVRPGPSIVSLALNIHKPLLSHLN